MYRSIFLIALLTAGCQLASSTDDDPLPFAVREGNVGEVRALLARGADPNRQFGVNSWPPLMHAVHKNQLETAAVLLEHGADVNKGGPEGMTPLMMAAGYGNDAMVALLLRHRADPHLKTRDGANVLDFALTGVSDIDKFTLFRCQDSTVSLLVRTQPSLRGTAETSSRNFARLKRCVTAS